MRSLALSIVMATVGCSGASPGGIPGGMRLVTGQLVAPTPAELGTTPGGGPAFQLVGVHDKNTLFFGDPFDVTMQSGGDVTLPFRLLVPCDQTVSLHFQRIGNSPGNQLADVVALFEFPLNASGSTTTTLVAWEKGCGPEAPGREIKLGTVKIDFAAKRVHLPGDAGGTNPLSEVVTLRQDGETASNLDNADDDGDGMPDEMDPDEDGDGVEDAMEGLLSFQTI